MVQKKLLTKESVVMFQINVPNNSNNIIENKPDDTKIIKLYKQTQSK